MLHELKTWREPFEAVWDDLKSFEFRKNDRDFKVGDSLLLKEYVPAFDRYTGRVIVADVKHIQKGGIFCIPEGYCIMSLAIIKKIEGKDGGK